MDEMTLAEAVRLRDLRRRATFTGDLDDAIADIPPGWWYSLGYCSVSCDASIGPDVAYCDKDTLKRFDSGFHADIPQPSTLAEALRNCLEQAETAIAAAARQGGDVKQAPAESPQSGAARQSPVISKGYSTTKGWGG